MYNQMQRKKPKQNQTQCVPLPNPQKNPMQKHWPSQSANTEHK